MERLSRKQKDIYLWIRRFKAKEGQSPTFKEIGVAFKIHSSNGVSQHLQALRKKGYIDWSKHTPRSIRIINDISSHGSMPVLERIPAGPLSEDLLNHEEALDFSSYFERKDVFAFRVRGDSMIDAGIQNNDFAIVKLSPTVDNGAIGVVEINDEATVKYIFFKKNKIILKPANSTYKKMEFDIRRDNIQIDGPVIGIFRSLNNGFALKENSR